MNGASSACLTHRTLAVDWGLLDRAGERAGERKLQSEVEDHDACEDRRGRGASTGSGRAVTCR